MPGCWRTSSHSSEVSGPALSQHAVRDADLADVVEEGDVLQLDQALVVPPELAPEQRRIAGHAAGVAERVVVLGAEGRAQGAQVGEVQPLDLLVEICALDGEGDSLATASATAISSSVNRRSTWSSSSIVPITLPRAMSGRTMKLRWP